MKTYPIEGFTIADPRPHTWSLHGKHGMMVSIDMDTGETTFGAAYTLDEAARVFWEALGGYRKHGQRTAKIFDIDSIAERNMHESALRATCFDLALRLSQWNTTDGHRPVVEVIALSDRIFKWCHDGKFTPNNRVN